MQDLALRHEVLDRARNVFDRYRGIDSMLVEEIDAVGAEPLEHTFHDHFDVTGPAVEPWAPHASVLIDVPAELRCDYHLVSKRCYGLAEDSLRFMRAVRFGGVEERDATVEGRPNDVDHLGPVRHRRFIPAAHVLNAEANAGHLQASEFSPSGHSRCVAGGGGHLHFGGRVRGAD